MYNLFWCILLLGYHMLCGGTKREGQGVGGGGTKGLKGGRAPALKKTLTLNHAH